MDRSAEATVSASRPAAVKTARRCSSREAARLTSQCVQDLELIAALYLPDVLPVRRFAVGTDLCICSVSVVLLDSKRRRLPPCREAIDGSAEGTNSAFRSVPSSGSDQSAGHCWSSIPRGRDQRRERTHDC